MEDIRYFFDNLITSKISLLGYTFKNEIIKDEIISKIPHVEIDEIDSSFSLKTYLRDSKIKRILSEESSEKITKWLIVDINNIRSKLLIDKFKLIKQTLDRIKSDIYSESNSNFKLLVTCPTYNTQNGVDSANQFLGGSTPIYISDFACSMPKNGEYLQIIKNRNGEDKLKISLDKLKDYNYICNYENNQ